MSSSSSSSSSHIESLDASENEDRKFKLVSKQGEKFEVLAKWMNQSELVDTMATTDRDENEFPIPNVESDCLRRIIPWLKYHHYHPWVPIEKPLKSSDLRNVMVPFDLKFVNSLVSEMIPEYKIEEIVPDKEEEKKIIVTPTNFLSSSSSSPKKTSPIVKKQPMYDISLLEETLLGANYMAIKPLLELLSAKKASLILGMKREYMRELFHMVDDFPKEKKEEKKIETSTSTLIALPVPSSSSSTSITIPSSSSSSTSYKVEEMVDETTSSYIPTSELLMENTQQSSSITYSEEDIRANQTLPNKVRKLNEDHKEEEYE